jgi:hypothetical protein
MRLEIPVAAEAVEGTRRDKARANKRTPQVMRVRVDERNVDMSRSVMGTENRSSVGRVKTNHHRKRDHLVSQKATDLPERICLNQAQTSLIQLLHLDQMDGSPTAHREERRRIVILYLEYG